MKLKYGPYKPIVKRHTVDIRAGKHTVAVVQQTKFIPHDTAQPESDVTIQIARLLSKAPEMYDMLQKVAEWFSLDKYDDDNGALLMLRWEQEETLLRFGKNVKKILEYIEK